MQTTRNTHRNGRRNSRLIAWTIAALGSTVALGASQDTGQTCSARTIRGDFGIQMQGTRPVPPPTGGIESVVGVVLRNYDGDGNFTQIDNIKGSVTGIVPDRPGSGTYEVNPDCSGVTLFQPDPNNPNLVIREKLVILRSGAEIRAMTESPAPLMVTSVAKRINGK
jgi:hypothetical protein